MTVRTATRAALLVAAALLAAGDGRAATFAARVTDAAGAPVRDAAVFLVPVGGTKPAAAMPAAVIEQRDRDFVPFVSVVRTGTSVTFPNRDQMLHHVYSFSPARSFQIKLYEGDPPNPIVFDKPGVVAVGCNIHDWMQAYVVVVDSPHFAVSDASGDVRVQGVPAGAYELRAWHPHAGGEWTSAHRVAEGDRAAVPITLAMRSVARKPKPPLDPNRY